MSTLISIVAEMHRIESALIESQGEVTEEIVRDLAKFEENKVKLLDKVDSYQYVIEQSKERAAYWKKRKDELARIEKSFKALETTLKTLLKQAMVKLEAKELRGVEFYFKLQKTRPKIEYDEKKIPDAYKRQVVSTEIDKDAIKSDIDLGIQIEGVNVIEGKTIRAYVNKEKK